MLKRIIYLFVLLFVGAQAHGQITFNRTYNTLVDAAFNIVELSDGYMFAQMAGLPIYPQNTVIRKLNFNGITQWQKAYGDSTEYRLTYSLIKTYDGNYVAGSYNYDFVDDTLFGYLRKITVNGDSLWEKKYSPPSGYNYFSVYVIETSDKGFLITGSIADTALVDANVYILKTDSLGNELWHKTYGGAKFDIGHSSIELPDKNFLTLGWTRSFGFGNSNNRDYYLIKTDSLGNFLWQKTFGTILDDVPVGITATAGGNYLIAGGQAVGINNAQGNIIKIDTAGNIIWSKQYGDVLIDEFWWARELINGDIIAVGSKENNPPNSTDYGWIVRTDSAGNQLWERSFLRGHANSYFRDVKQTSDGGFICAGFVFEGPDSTQDAWLVKLDSVGCDNAGCAIYTGIEENTPSITSNSLLHLFPNPAKDFITIDFSKNPFAFVKISVFNTLGQRVLLLKQPVRDFATLDVSKLNAGIYTVMAEYEGLREMGKFVKQ